MVCHAIAPRMPWRLHGCLLLAIADAAVIGCAMFADLRDGFGVICFRDDTVA